jgi:hypothetical protein
LELHNRSIAEGDRVVAVTVEARQCGLGDPRYAGAGPLGGNTTSCGVNSEHLAFAARMRRVGYLISMVGLLLVFTVKIGQAHRGDARHRRAQRIWADKRDAKLCLLTTCGYTDPGISHREGRGGFEVVLYRHRASDGSGWMVWNCRPREWRLSAECHGRAAAALRLCAGYVAAATGPAITSHSA